MIRKNYLPAKSLDLILIPQSEDQIKKNGLPALILALSACLARAEDQRAPWEGGISSDRASNTTCTVTVHKLRQPWTPPDTHMHTHAHTHTHTHTRAHTHTHTRYMGFPGGAVVKNTPANAGDSRDAGSIPGSGRSPGGRNGNPFQYSCLENPRRGNWRAIVHRVAESQTQPSHTTHAHTTHTHTCTHM